KMAAQSERVSDVAPLHKELGAANRHRLHWKQIGVVGGVLVESALGLRLGYMTRVAPARQVVSSGITATAATAAHAKLGFEVGQRPGPGSNGFLDLTFRDGITYANKHENNYQPHNRC